MKCGANLGSSTAQSTTQSNVQLQKAKQLSKMYFSYFGEVLKNPVRTGQASTADHMTNGLITMILFSLVLPLIFYFQIKASARKYGGFLIDHLDVPFGSVVVKPFFFLILIVLMVNSIVFLVLKMGNVTVRYQEITARFGTFMIPSVTFLVVGLLFTWLGIGGGALGWVIGVGLFSWFVAICFTIYSFKRDHTSGLDAYYAVVITYAASILILYLFGDSILGSLLKDLMRL
ncbi:hypothetical protein [Cohnella terricola]|uniref:Yip1 domain-containing protein n=1 Tax=Cohnella terricola TaxID=1289167 RepID=A0A559JN34_9BACL|nr:hypothetical protein [Cohnella terricola]TVY01287.1 hypothetical protein FPZ45_09060 [Cohnella terricola]